MQEPFETYFLSKNPVNFISVDNAGKHMCVFDHDLVNLNDGKYVILEISFTEEQPDEYVKRIATSILEQAYAANHTDEEIEAFIAANS